MKRVHLFLTLLACLVAGPLKAQVTTAGIHGTVNDRSGAVVANADVTVTNTDNNFSRTVKSDGVGEYTFTGLPLGPYRVEALLAGFKKFVQTGLVLDVNRNARLEIVLDVGVQTESVAIASGVALVNVADAQMGRTVQTKEIIQLPLVNRDVYSLLNLTPGVEMNSTGNTVGFRQTTVAINGSNDSGAGSVSYYLDGGANMTGLRNTGNSTPNPDAVREFRVITNG
jgi:Carboxypeptidase regulatory-like domain